MTTMNQKVERIRQHRPPGSEHNQIYHFRWGAACGPLIARGGSPLEPTPQGLIAWRAKAGPPGRQRPGSRRAQTLGTTHSDEGQGRQR